MKKYVAEFIGTLTLVLFGTGIAVVSGGDLVATSLAFGLAIVASAYVIGNISGCHVNPAVSFAMYINKKLSLKEFVLYVLSQVLGAICGTAILYLILSNTNIGVGALGANGYGSLSANNISLLGAAITEVVLTFIFVYTILGVTSDESKSDIAGYFCQSCKKFSSSIIYGRNTFMSSMGIHRISYGWCFASGISI